MSEGAERPIGPADAAVETAQPVGLTRDLDAMSDDIVDALKTVYDPEIPVNIFDLGLIYKIDVKDHGAVEVEMTLTAPGCPVAGEMPGWVEKAVGEVEGVSEVKVNLVFDPPWDQSKMTDEAKLELGLI
jgi:FeS assembly SUF system protein